MDTGHLRSLIIESNDIMICLTEQGNTWVTEKYNLVVLLKNKSYMQNVSKIILG